MQQERTCHHAVEEQAHEVGPVLWRGRLEDAGDGLLVRDGMHQAGIPGSLSLSLAHPLQRQGACAFNQVRCSYEDGPGPCVSSRQSEQPSVQSF